MSEWSKTVTETLEMINKALQRLGEWATDIQNRLEKIEEKLV